MLAAGCSSTNENVLCSSKLHCYQCRLSSYNYCQIHQGWNCQSCPFFYFTIAFNRFTPDSTKSKTDKFSKITNWVKLKNNEHRSKVLLNSFPMNSHTLRILSIESKVRKLCITQRFNSGGSKGQRGIQESGKEFLRIYIS